MKYSYGDFVEAKHNTSVAAEAPEVATNVVTQWIDRGFFEPSLRSEGSGGRHKFSAADLCRLRIFSHLVERGYSRNAAGALVRQCLFMDYGPLFHYFDAYLTSGDPVPMFVAFVKDGRETRLDYIETKEQMAELYSSGYNDVYLVNLGKVVEEVISIIRKYEYRQAR